MEKIQDIAKKFELTTLILFGSEAKGNKKKESDLDIAYLSQKTVDNEELYSELTDYFQRADIDLIDLRKSKSHFFIFNVLKEGKVLYEKEKGIARKLLWKAYIDYKDFERFYEKKKKIIDKKASAIK